MCACSNQNWTANQVKLTLTRNKYKCRQNHFQKQQHSTSVAKPIRIMYAFCCELHLHILLLTDYSTATGRMRFSIHARDNDSLQRCNKTFLTKSKKSNHSNYGTAMTAPTDAPLLQAPSGCNYKYKYVCFGISRV